MQRSPWFQPLITTHSWWFSNWRTRRIPEVDHRLTAFLVAVLLGCLASTPSPSHAGMDLEIDHLLRYIESSDCTFNRNGTLHDSRDASAHIRKKYAHVKRRINSTEEFIRYAATKSSMSGRLYLVICDGVEMPTAQWLVDELARFRQESR